jgi:hypothetical protein
MNPDPVSDESPKNTDINSYPPLDPKKYHVIKAPIPGLFAKLLASKSSTIGEDPPTTSDSPPPETPN